VDAVIDVQRRGIELVRTLAKAGAQPQARWVADGYAEELEQRLAWSLAHRHLFDAP
jgi:hypothetical protein